MFRCCFLIGLLIFGAEFLLITGDEIEVPIISTLSEPEDGTGTVMVPVPNLEELVQNSQQEASSSAAAGTVEESLAEISKIVDMLENEADDSDLPSNCEEAMEPNELLGVHKIYIKGSSLPAFFVKCLRIKAQEWMIIQRRWDGSINFQRTWEDYKNGFGNLNGEYWLGLDLLHALTNSQPHEIWFEMDDHQGQRRFARYDQFLIGDESSNYTLQALGKYVGNAGDSFRYQVGNQFSTKDRDNDSKPDGNCAALLYGGWWFGNCRECHFNGLYQNNEKKFDKGINWYGWRGRDYSLKYVHMAIRPTGGTGMSKRTNAPMQGSARQLLRLRNKFN